MIIREALTDLAEQIADTVGKPAAAHCRWVLGVLLQEAVTAGVLGLTSSRT